MTKKNKLLIAVLCLAALLCIALFSCRNEEAPAPQDKTPPTTTGTAGEPTVYTVVLQAEGGMPLESVGIYIYTDDTLKDLFWFAKTDDKGKITFEAPAGSYALVLKDVPDGYLAEDQYSLTGETTTIVLTAGMASADNLEGVTFELGDMMYDLTVTTPDGKEYKLSELLKEKAAVVLNFWYMECNPCRAEFPYLQQAYEQYSDKIEVLALNPVNTDDAAIAAFQKELGLTFPVAQCDPAWQQAMQLKAYPTTVVVDRYGNIGLIHAGSVTEEGVFEDVFEYFTADDYQQGLVKDLEDVLEAAKTDEDTTGTKDNPVTMSGVSSFQVTIQPGADFYCDIYKVSKLNLSYTNQNVAVTYKNNEYKAGSVSFTIASDDVRNPVELKFHNNGSQEETFTVYLSQPKGSLNNPYSMNLGEFTVNIPAGSEQGLYYTYKCTADGTISISCLSATSGVPYSYTLYNLNTYAQRSMDAEGATDADGNPVVHITVNKGDTIQFNPSALPDSSGNYPAGTFKFLASYSEEILEGTVQEQKITYAVTVTDGDRNPVSNVQIYVIDGEKTHTINTNDKGVASIKLVPGTYKATLKVPAGYEAKTTEITLTEAIPTAAIKIDAINVEMADYTVTVQDAGGAAIENAMVSIGDSYGYTDATGQITFHLPVAAYSAVVSAEGYKTANLTFVEGQTQLTAVLEAGEDAVTGIEYSVQVVDYFGSPLTNAVVRFLKDGVLVGSPVAVDSTGTAKAKLEAGDYTAALAFSGSDSYYYDASKAVLSEETPSIQVVAVKRQDGTYIEDVTNVGIAYYVYPGATYAELETSSAAEIFNYFLFEPTESGLYQVTTSDPSAKVSNWATSSYPFNSSDSVENNSYTINVKDYSVGNIGYVIGVSGAEDCILVITRLGDAEMSIEDYPWSEDWQTEDAPTTQFSLKENGSQLTYVDVSGETADYTLVKGSDGYYHLGTEDGPIVYVNLGPNAPYVSMYNMLGFAGNGGGAQNLCRYFYDEDGNFVKKEKYTDCMRAYVEMRDSKYDVYPLTDDLIYMLQNGGEHADWWDADSATYMFGGVELNTEIAWMFALCYIP